MSITSYVFCTWLKHCVCSSLNDIAALYEQKFFKVKFFFFYTFQRIGSAIFLIEITKDGVNSRRSKFFFQVDKRIFFLVLTQFFFSSFWHRLSVLCAKVYSVVWNVVIDMKPPLIIQMMYDLNGIGCVVACAKVIQQWNFNVEMILHWSCIWAKYIYHCIVKNV